MTDAVRLVVAVTDGDWFNFLRSRPWINEVNFWSPSPKAFRALQPGELFLFKLHAPINKIVGGGVFASSTVMPLGLAWDAFGDANGVGTLPEMRNRIMRYRRLEDGGRAPIEIGCRILTQPFFLDEAHWINPPPSWSPNIVSLRGYSTAEEEGSALWMAVQDAMQGSAQQAGFAESSERYGKPTLINPRLGQGSFRLIVTDLYSRKCAVTGEKTLPALDAAHIRPYADGGAHSPNNGILMRRDLHSLFDAGYVTITPDYKVEVSRRIREEFDNGRHYYALHGSELAVPDNPAKRPDSVALDWHNRERFLA